MILSTAEPLRREHAIGVGGGGHNRLFALQDDDGRTGPRCALLVDHLADEHAAGTQRDVFAAPTNPYENRTTVPREDVFTAAEGVFGRGARGLGEILENILRDDKQRLSGIKSAAPDPQPGATSN